MRKKRDLTEVHFIIKECSIKKRAIIVRKIAHILNISKTQSYELFNRATQNRTKNI